LQLHVKITVQVDLAYFLTVNLSQILNSKQVRGEKETIDHIKGVLSRITDEHPVLKCLKEVRFDVSRNLDRITFASPRGKDLKAGLLILEGAFSVRELNAALNDMARANPKAHTLTWSGGSAIYEIATSTETQYFVSLINNTTLVLATSMAVLIDVLDRSKDLKKSGLALAFTTLLETTNDKQSVSFVATGPALALLIDGVSIPNATAAVAALKTIDGLAGAITIAPQFQFQLGIFARDDETAKKLADAGNNACLTLRTLVQQKAKEDNKLLPLVDVVKSLRITTQGPTLLLRGEASLNVNENLMSLLPGGPAEARREGLGQ
jgi:hypothetical protein